MGSSRPRNSTRLRPMRSVHKPRRKPAPPKPSKLRKAAGALRDAERVRAAGAAEQFRVSPTQAVREMRDGVPATALRAIRRCLELIQSSVIVVSHALREQNCELDDDADRVLTRHVSDALMDQIESIDSLLGESPRDDSEEDGQGEQAS
jgi:hypothetical protein